jgi:hypothetical protein
MHSDRCSHAKRGLRRLKLRKFLETLVELPEGELHVRQDRKPTLELSSLTRMASGLPVRCPKRAFVPTRTAKRLSLAIRIVHIVLAGPLP